MSNIRNLISEIDNRLGQCHKQIDMFKDLKNTLEEIESKVNVIEEFLNPGENKDE